MRFHHTFIILLLLISFSAQAYELIMIQAVSSSKKTFVTRNGKRQGIIRGVTGTFTAEDVSILAKAVTVTGTHTQWEISNSDAILPFEKGTIVTYYPASEYIWALSPEAERRKYIKSQIPTPRRSWVFKGALTRAVSESVSEVPATANRRGGYLGEIFYESDIIYGLAFDIGLRYEREIINYTGASFVTSRSMLIGDLIYYIDTLRDYISGRLFLGAGVGYGRSSTSSQGGIQSGVVGLLPTVKAGLSLPFNDTWEFIFDVAFESIQTSEQRAEASDQTTTQTNFKTGFGLRRYF